MDSKGYAMQSWAGFLLRPSTPWPVFRTARQGEETPIVLIYGKRRTGHAGDGTARQRTGQVPAPAAATGIVERDFLFTPAL